MGAQRSSIGRWSSWSHLVDDLLDVTRVTQNKIQLQRQRLDLNELVRATIDDNRRHLERDGVRVDAELASAPIYVNADGVRIAQVLTNLLANAVKFTPPGGTATVSVCVGSGRATRCCASTDSGVGHRARAAPAGCSSRSCRRIVTLARSGGGLGLGLALVKGLVELHGGTREREQRGHRAGRRVRRAPSRSTRSRPRTTRARCRSAAPAAAARCW